MKLLRLLTPVALCLVACAAQTQIRGAAGSMVANTGDIDINVIFTNDRPAGANLLVQLMQGSSSAAVGTTWTNDRGGAHFINVPIGMYHVEVKGDGIQTTTSDTFEIDSRKISQSQYVTVRQVEDMGPKPVSSRSAMISAADLNVPDKARKEVDKANEEMAKHNWKKAEEHLNKAIGLYPQYATAYNNLGVLYAKMNDIPKEEEALKKAVELNDHFAAALINYGKLSLGQKNPVQAEALLQKALTAEPGNPETLMLLSYAQFLNRHFDAAVRTALQAHSSGQEHASFVHYIAARSYQQQNHPQQALEQMQIFLAEEPHGPRADLVRSDMAKMQSAGPPPTAQ
jgi:tetratricopeptide (TPR) repeat protein